MDKLFETLPACRSGVTAARGSLGSAVVEADHRREGREIGRVGVDGHIGHAVNTRSQLFATAHQGGYGGEQQE